MTSKHWPEHFGWGGDQGTDATRGLLRLLLHQIETGAGIVARCTWHCSAQCAQLLSLSCICSGSSEADGGSGALGAGSWSPQPAPLLAGCACNWSTFELVWQITLWQCTVCTLGNRIAPCPRIFGVFFGIWTQSFYKSCSLTMI